MGRELEIERMLNVAVSRARGQVLVFATRRQLGQERPVPSPARRRRGLGPSVEQKYRFTVTVVTAFSPPLQVKYGSTEGPT